MKDREKTMLEARGQLEALLDYLTTAAEHPHPLHAIERDVWDGLLALGRTLLKHYVQQVGVGDVGPTLVQEDGPVLWRGEVTSRPYLSVFGELAIERYVYGSTADPQAPLDAQLNLPEWKYSYLLQEWGLAFTTKESFKEAGQTLEQILRIGLAVRPLERLAGKASAGVAPFRAALPVPVAEEEGALLVATADCKGVPLRRPKSTASKRGKRRKKGEKKNKKKMACVGAVYSIDPFVRTPADILDETQRQACAVDRPVPYHKRVEAQLLDDKEALFAALAQQVQQRQTEGQPLLFLSDGERSLWTLKKTYLPEAIGILDLWHVMEYLWKGAHVFHPEGSTPAEEWVRHQLALLLDGKVGYVIGGLKQRLTKHRLKGPKKKSLHSVITYFHNNRAHMRYDEYIAQGYPIGSGVAEGACRHLVKDRMERTGMRWIEDGAQAILDLRSTYLNGEWPPYWDYYPTVEKERLYGHLTVDQTKTYKATA
jgi:hypothetical protein